MANSYEIALDSRLQSMVALLSRMDKISKGQAK